MLPTLQIKRVFFLISVIVENGTQRLTHAPRDVIEQFLSNPNSFVNFLEENYLPHFSSADQADKAASVLSDADYMLAEWRVLYFHLVSIDVYCEDQFFPVNPLGGW